MGPTLPTVQPSGITGHNLEDQMQPPLEPPKTFILTVVLQRPVNTL